MTRGISKTGVVVCLLALAAGPAGAQAADGLDALWSPDGYDQDPGWTMPPPALGPLDPGTLATREAAARAAVAAAEAEIRAVLASKINVPAPPVLDLSCQETEAAQGRTMEQVNAWVRAATEPEATLLEQLDAARRELQLLGVDEGAAYATEALVAHRIGAKARAVMAANGKAPGSIPAVVGLVRRAAQMEGLLGNTAEFQSLMDTLAA